MAYYTALITAWNAGTVPGGVTGSALTGTTAQKLAAVNAWTVSGPNVDVQPAQVVRYLSISLKLATLLKWQVVVLPRPGCGNGRLDWFLVERTIAPWLDDRFVVVTL